MNQKQSSAEKIVALWRTWRRLFRLWVLLGFCWVGATLAAPQTMFAQMTDTVPLTIQLRHSDGTAVSAEAIVLQRLPDVETVPPACLTDAAGRCTWHVGRGLYQVRFERPLDHISALALAEGGLSGLGITVGEASITYHFTFHRDGRVYFDAAPEATVPQPIIPAGQMLQGGIMPSPTLPAGEAVPGEATATAAPTAGPDTAVAAEGGSGHLFLYIAGGLLLGLALYLFTRLEQVRHRLGQPQSKGGKPHA